MRMCISSNATTVTAWRRIRRSKSPSSPFTQAPTSQAWGAARSRATTGSASTLPGQRGRRGSIGVGSHAQATGAVTVPRRPAPAAAPLAGARGGHAPARARPRGGPRARMAHLARDRLALGVAERAHVRVPGELLAVRVEHADDAADGAGGGAHDLGETALLEHESLQALLNGHRAAQRLELLTGEVGEGALGDGDERQLVGHLEDRELELARSREQRGRNALVREAGAEADGGDAAVLEALHELALRLGFVEL